jgi:hypothetical protein
MLVMSYGVAIAVVTRHPPTTSSADVHRKSGGLRHYRGEHFMVELCGTGSDPGRRDHIRLRIFDEQARAVRYFTVQHGAAPTRI